MQLAAPRARLQLHTGKVREHVWALATVKETLSEDEVQRRAEEFMSAMFKKR
jgi:hypothetical protein